MVKPRLSIFVLGVLLLTSVNANWSDNKDDTEEDEQTTGVFYDWGATEGVHLFHPREGMTTYLIDIEGNEIHQWQEPDGLQSRGSQYLTEEGTLLVAVRIPSDWFNFPGPVRGGAVREYNKEGDCIWEFRYSSTLYRQLRDFVILPNGNIIATATENHPWFNAKARGYTGDCDLNPDGFWSETLIEVERKGHKNLDYDNSERFDGDINNTCKMVSDEKDLVWKWDSFDHSTDYINYAKWDINKDFVISHIDYLPSRDHIVIACYTCCEIFIIDHSVEFDKVSGKEGHFIYRWGAPPNYNQEGVARLNPWGVQWVRDNYGWEFKYEDGSVIIYNNDDPEVEGTDSSVVELTPPYKEGKYEMDKHGVFGPDDFNYKIMDIQEKIEKEEEKEEPKNNYGYGNYGYNNYGYNNYGNYGSQKTKEPEYEYVWRNFNSEILGFAHKLPDGNVFITNSMNAEALEIQKFDRSIWKYVSVYSNEGNDDGINDEDDILGKTEPIPVCDEDEDLCNRFPLMIKYSKKFAGFDKLFD